MIACDGEDVWIGLEKVKIVVTEIHDVKDLKSWK